MKQVQLLLFVTVMVSLKFDSIKGSSEVDEPLQKKRLEKFEEMQKSRKRGDFVAYCPRVVLRRCFFTHECCASVDCPDGMLCCADGCGFGECVKRGPHPRRRIELKFELKKIGPKGEHYCGARLVPENPADPDYYTFIYGIAGEAI